MISTLSLREHHKIVETGEDYSVPQAGETKRQFLPLNNTGVTSCEGTRSAHSAIVRSQSATFAQVLVQQLRPRKSSIVVTMDLFKAFITISHSTLLEDISNSTQPNKIKRF